jgi:hypothetical protein
MSDELGESIHFRPSRIVSEKIRELAKRERISQSDIMRRVLDSYFAGESKMTMITIQSTLGDAEQLSLFLGALHRLREHWRDSRSRINLPRPIRPGDDEEMAQWRKQKEQIAEYFSACEDAKKRLERLEHFFLGLTPAEYENLKNLGELSGKAVGQYEEKLAEEIDPTKRANLGRNAEYFKLVLKWLRALGVIDVQ